MTDEIKQGDRVSWRFSPQPRHFGTVYRTIISEDVTTGKDRVIGYRVFSEAGHWLVLASADITKEFDQ
jgi:hypothetical protein